MLQTIMAVALCVSRTNRRTCPASAGAFWVVLHFFALLFASRQKVEKLCCLDNFLMQEIASYLAMTEKFTVREFPGGARDDKTRI